jgi:hypothetical protein
MKCVFLANLTIARSKRFIFIFGTANYVPSGMKVVKDNGKLEKFTGCYILIVTK